ncbi:DoxX family protein [Streptomyces avermitilis]
MSRSERSSLLLAGLLATAGVAHFAAPRQFDATIPRALPGKPRTWTYASGVAELALAAGVALPRTRRAAALATAAFFVGVFPANVQMAVDWRHRPAPLRTAALARLPLQVPLVLWARGVAKGTEGRS